MSNIFNLDAPIWVFMGEVADIIILGLLWWCCCLGIITMGASTTALYYVLGKKMRREQTYVVKDFFKSFSQNFRQSVPLSILMIIAFISLALYISFIFTGVSSGQEVPYLKYMIPVTILFAFEILNIHSYSWALLSRFEMPTRGIIKTAFIITHRHLVGTIWNLIVIGAVAYGIIKFPLLVIVAPSLIVFAQSYMIQPIFTGYIEVAEERNKAAEQEVEDIEFIETIEEVASTDESGMENKEGH